MASTQARAMSGSCLGSLLGSVIGAVVCFAGFTLLRIALIPHVHTGAENVYAIGLLNVLPWVACVSGGLVGLVVGGMLGAGLATRDKSANGD